MSSTTTRSLLVVTALFSAACASASASPARVGAPPPSSKPEPALASELLPLEGVSAPAPAVAAPRRVGDLVVHRFHGQFSRKPLTLTERVSALEGDVLVVDYELLQGDKRESLRVRLSARSERVVAVSRLTGDTEVPAELSDYEQLLARTSFAPDENAGLIGSGSETCLVGPDEYNCQVNKYRVFVGDREAALTVRNSEAAGRDLSGEIVGLDGTVVYKAELIELRRGPLVAEPGDNASARLEAR